MRRFTVLIVAAASLLSCMPSERTQTPDLLYVWAFDTNQESSDFLTVIDADREASTYGAILDTLPVGLVGGAHHTEHRMPDGNILFANAFPAGTTFLFDVSRPRAPGVASSFAERGAYTFLHSSERLPNGNVLATFQNRSDGKLEPGGLVELDPQGRYLRGADAADPDVDPQIRPYSLAILPEIDRVISTTADMRGKLLPTSVQLWQLSELRLLKTVLLPPGERGDENQMPAEPRALQDGRSVVVNTFSCGLYLLTELDTAEPVATHLRTFPYEPPHRCALAARIGDFWVQTVPTSEALVSLDLSDPSAPRLVQELKLGENYRPHWMAADRSGHRIVVTGRGDMEHLVLLVRFDPESGQMEIDSDFRDEGSRAPGVSFERAAWRYGDGDTARRGFLPLGGSPEALAKEQRIPSDG